MFCFAMLWTEICFWGVEVRVCVHWWKRGSSGSCSPFPSNSKTLHIFSPFFFASHQSITEKGSKINTMQASNQKMWVILVAHMVFFCLRTIKKCNLLLKVFVFVLKTRFLHLGYISFWRNINFLVTFMVLFLWIYLILSSNKPEKSF